MQTRSAVFWARSVISNTLLQIDERKIDASEMGMPEEEERRAIRALNLTPEQIRPELLSGRLS